MAAASTREQSPRPASTSSSCANRAPNFLLATRKLAATAFLDGVTLDGTLHPECSPVKIDATDLIIINNLTLNSTLDLSDEDVLYFVHGSDSGPYGQTLSGSGSIVFRTGGTIDVANSAYDSSTSVRGRMISLQLPAHDWAGMTDCRPPIRRYWHDPWTDR